MSAPANTIGFGASAASRNKSRSQRWIGRHHQSAWLSSHAAFLKIRWQAGMSAREHRATHRAGSNNQQYTIMQDYSIERAGIANLDFTGELIGQSGGANPRVKIYRTTALKFIGENRADLKMAQAQHFDKPVDLINWLKYANGGVVTAEVQDAIEDAAKHDDAFKSAWNEHVD
jgi:hypothetical protein